MLRQSLSRIALALIACLWASLAFGQPSWQRSGTASGTGYPAGSQPFSATASGTTGAAVTVTQPTGFQNTYVCTLTFTEAGGTGITINGSLTHAIGGVTLTFAQLGQLTMTFTPCLPNDGQSMVATTPTTTAATASAVNVTGYFY